MNQRHQRYEDLVGLSLEEETEFLIETTPLASALTDRNDTIGSLSSTEVALRISSLQTPTVLDETLSPVQVVTTDRDAPASLEVNIPTPREIVVAAALPDAGTPTMVIYPPPASRQQLSPGTIEIPTFRVRYVVRDVPPRCQPECVAIALDTARRRFEGDVLFDLLMKAVRSQRNVVKEPFDLDVVGHAMLILEHDALFPVRAILNPTARDAVRTHIEANGGLLRGMETSVVVPSRRGSEGRSYFVCEPIELGIVARSDVDVSRDRQDDGLFSITWSLRLGMVIHNRACVSSIDD